MRTRTLLALLPAFCSAGFAQEGYTGPDVVITVTSANKYEQLVDIGFAPDGYPESKIREHVERWKAETKQPVGDFQVRTNTVKLEGGPPQKVVHASFGTRGLVDQDKGTLDIQSIVRAFASFDNIDIRLMDADFAYKGFGSYRYPRKDTIVAMEADPDPNGLSVRVHLNRHDPSAIMIPALYEEPKKAPAAPPPAPPIGLYITIVALISLGGGVLVYYVLRSSAKREAG